MKKTAIDWELLRGLRSRFLGDATGGSDYWDSPRLLDQYDQTFGMRIAWKWQAVWSEVSGLGLLPNKPLTIVDWGCGTGTASRQAVLALGADAITAVWLHDRSKKAVAFAAEKLEPSKTKILQNPQLDVIPENTLLLISHVTNELKRADMDLLLSTAERAAHIMWVEPGTPVASQTLIVARERLRKTFTLVAPCPHQSTCGLLAPERSRDWCHHFAPPPLEAFQSRFWHEFSEEMKIDLRSLPTSYLVASRKCPLPAKGNRVLGRPRLYNGYANALVCEEGGVRERKILERDHGMFIKSLRQKKFTISLPPSTEAT